MSGLRSLFGSGSQPTTTPEYTGLQIQTAVSTLPVPIVWGQAKLAPNLIWYANFQVHQKSGGGAKSGGGKGGLFGSGSGTVGYTYSADVILAVCEGPITGVNRIWKNQSTYTLSGLGLSLFLGTTPQTVWGYLAATSPAQALAYQGTAYVAGANYNLSEAATLDNHNFEVRGFRYATGYGPGGTASDADPAQIVSDFLTNTQYGLGFPPESIDTTTLFGSGSDASYQTYCRAVGLALSLALINQEQASSILGRWLQLTNTAAVWSGGLLRFVPYGDQDVTGNGVTFKPNVAPIYNLSDDDFASETGQDPLQITRSDPFQAYNVWRLEIADRANAYNLVSIESRDQNAIERYGMRVAPTVTAREICSTNIGLIAGQLQLQRAVYIRNIYKFRLSWEYCLLDPMDLVTITDPILGLDDAPIRITEIEEDENGLLQVTAEEFPQGFATATLYATESAVNTPIDRNSDPGTINTPIIFEPTDQLGGGLQIWAAVSGANPFWGGANVWMSYEEGGSYVQIGAVGAAARMGITILDLPAVAINTVGQTIDQAHALAVDLTESRGVLPTGTQTDALALNDLCYVGGEIVSYGDAALTAANKYDLSYLVRGAFGTEAAIVDHPAGTPFAFLDSAVFKYGYDQSRIGATIYLKFQSFNVWGGGLQSLADVPAYAYTITGSAVASPLPNVANLRSVFNVNTGFEQLVWDKVDDFRNPTYEVRSGASPSSAVTLDLDAQSPFTVPGNGTYWVAARCQPASGLVVYSEEWQSVAISGAVITQNVILNLDVAAADWPGIFDGSIGVDSTLNALRTGGTANVLAIADFLNTADILAFGGANGSGTYYPSNAFLDIGYVANASVSIAFQPTGVPFGQDILTIADILGTADILGAASTVFVDCYPLINTGTSTAGDLYGTGDLYLSADLYSNVLWNGWQKFAPGTYQARFLDFAMVLESIDPNTIGYDLAFKITVTIPARIDSYALTTSSSADTTITFQPSGAPAAAAFNGGPGPGNLPVISEGIVNAQAGDDFIITALSLSGMSFMILNSSARVERSLTLTVEGY